MDHESRLSRLATWSDLSPREIDEHVWVSGLDAEFDEGSYGDAGGVLEALRTRIGFRGTLTDLEDAWLRGFVPDRDLLELIDDLAPGVRCGILSDNGPVLLANLDRLLGDTLRRFDVVVFSCEIGYLKPAPESYEHALNRLGCDPGDVVFIDDRRANVEAAQVAGLHAYVYEDAGKTRETLEGWGMVNA